jgi:hypothetical protein
MAADVGCDGVPHLDRSLLWKYSDMETELVLVTTLQCSDDDDEADAVDAVAAAAAAVVALWPLPALLVLPSISLICRAVYVLRSFPRWNFAYSRRLCTMRSIDATDGGNNRQTQHTSHQSATLVIPASSHLCSSALIMAAYRLRLCQHSPHPCPSQPRSPRLICSPDSVGPAVD